jgi:hypothetical protein
MLIIYDRIKPTQLEREKWSRHFWPDLLPSRPSSTTILGKECVQTRQSLGKSIRSETQHCHIGVGDVCSVRPRFMHHLHGSCAHCLCAQLSFLSSETHRRSLKVCHRDEKASVPQNMKMCCFIRQTNHPCATNTEEVWSKVFHCVSLVRIPKQQVIVQW